MPRCETPITHRNVTIIRSLFCDMYVCDMYMYMGVYMYMYIKTMNAC